MNQRFILFRRAGIFYYEDTTTGKQLSLRTKNHEEAKVLLNAKNESFRQPILNLQIANAVKFFSAVELMALLADREWLDEATKAISQFWRRKNARRIGNSFRG